MPMNMGKPGRPNFVSPKQLRTGGGMNTSGEVVMPAMPRRFVSPGNLQAGGGLCLQCQETGEPCPGCEERVADMSKPKFIDPRFLNTPIVGNPTTMGERPAPTFVDPKFLNAPIIGNPDGMFEGLQFAALGQPTMMTTLQAAHAARAALDREPGGVPLIPQFGEGIAPEPVPSLPTPFRLLRPDTCKITRVTVRKARKAPAEPTPEERKAVSSGYIDMPYDVVIEGENLKKCEYTQSITIQTWLWDENGAELSRDDVDRIYREQHMSTRLSPFSVAQVDDGFYVKLGMGGFYPPSEWAQFTNETKEVILDHHRAWVPDRKPGIPYSWRRRADMIVVIRDKETKKTRAIHKWGYVAQNFPSTFDLKPSDDAMGIHQDYGMSEVYADKTGKSWEERHPGEY